MFRFTVVTFVLQVALSQAFTIQPRIVNGMYSNTTEFPYFINIIAPLSRSACSASLISDRWILTAAHCIRENEILHAYFGIGSDGSFLDAIPIDPINQYIHPGYYVNDRLNDIALLKLPFNIGLSKHIRPVKLTQTCDDFEDLEYVYAAGNGRTNLDQPIKKRLKQATFQVFSREQCDHILRGEIPSSASIICGLSIIGNSLGGGDSGGPLLRHKDNMLYGVNRGCVTIVGDNVTPPLQIFTRISYFFNWISHLTGLELPTC